MPQNQLIISDLVKKFNRNFDEYKNPKFNEAQVRIEFVNPFWKALGWDVDNDKGYSFAYRDVIHEDEVKIGRTTKAPDYSFRIGGSRVFFVETKKPAIDLKHDPAPAFQLRRYAYSAKLPISILTDFEEFIIYDCRMKPALTDKSHVGRILYYTFEEYLDKWDEISGMLSKEAIQQGELDRYIKRKEGKKPKAEIDRDFLNDLDNWRIQLARNIALRNPQLNERELNYAVQLTIDRLIFLRMSEDRGIETQFTLQALLNGENIYRRLVQIYYKADERYNSGLFHFEEKDGANPDTITPELALDDKILKDVISALYYPKCPYEFSVLPVEVLGNAYEQFLGKQISLTKGHHARIEEKPEVRKAGGVYYTPKYIVDYIVKNTVGKLCENKTPKEISELRILDPACGSGSFLLGAFQYLLDWHLEYYKNEFDKTGKIPNSPKPKGKQKRKSAAQVIFQGAGENWYLSTAEKKRILIDNIFGVDIDANAVEVTKLSLLLKVLENENSETLNRQLGLWHERALPNLENNIKCGNSLIGPDFYESQQTALFDEQEMYRINVFDWQSEFKEIFARGGFDVVIGNPPYIPIEFIKENEKGYYKKKYIYLERKWDSSIVFIISMLKLLNKNGYLSYISSLTWQTGENYVKLREHLFNQNGIEKIINLPFDVFKSAYVDTGIYIIRKSPQKYYDIYRFHKKEKNVNLEDISFKTVKSKLVQPPKFKVVLNPIAQSILLRIKNSERFIELGEISNSTQGLTASRYERFDNEDENLFPFLEKGQVYRYQLIIKKITYVSLEDKNTLIKYYDTHPKILIRRIINRQDRLMAACFTERLVFTKDLNPFLISEDFNIYFVLAIINSKLISYLYVNTSSIATKDDFRQTTLAELREIPILKLDINSQNELIDKSKYLFELNKKLPRTKDPQSQKQLQRQIEATDKQIDQLVYQLYGLTEEEIRIVEEAVN